MDKLILVFYINVGNYSSAEVNEVMNNMIQELEKTKENNIIYYYIPVRNQDTKVECINPKLVSDMDYIKAKESLDAAVERLSKIIIDL